LCKRTRWPGPTIIIHVLERSLCTSTTIALLINTPHFLRLCACVLPTPCAGGAVDAAVAATLCIGVVNSHSSGIGGGGFMVVYNGSGGAEVIDFREMAPENATELMFTGFPDCAPDGGQGDSTRCPSRLGGVCATFMPFSRTDFISLRGEQRVRVSSVPRNSSSPHSSSSSKNGATAHLTTCTLTHFFCDVCAQIRVRCALAFLNVIAAPVFATYAVAMK